ncbi:Cys/Met metabolism PLP-dependent enzyme-domain-containing protein [Suillus subluteus]|nr:Cys/Met metabolism PLP-dependent enzyme-domain-containing protein [Suillus subluteus]
MEVKFLSLTITGRDTTITISTTNGHANNVKHHLKRSSEPGFSTRAIHIGTEPDPTTGAVIPSISLSTTYKQDEVGVHKGFEYSRSGNPNRDALERTLVGLQAGAGYAIVFASGSATTATILQSLGPNAHVLSVNDVYGGTFRYMTRVAKETTGTETTFLDLENAADDEILGTIKENTKLIWIESPTNYTLRLIDIPRIVGLARQAPSKPLILVDNTFLSPFHGSPLLQGADIAIHSFTEYVNGHSDVMMGAAILPSSSTPNRDYDDLVQKLRFLQMPTAPSRVHLTVGSPRAAPKLWSVDEGPRPKCTSRRLLPDFTPRRRTRHLPRSRFTPAARPSTHLPQPTRTAVPQHPTSIEPCARYTLRRDGLVPSTWWCKECRGPSAET